MAISIGSVEVDIVPNTRGIYAQLRAGLVPAAQRAGTDAGRAAGRSLGTAMRDEVDGLGTRIGQQLGRQIAARVTGEIRGALRAGITQGGAGAANSARRAGDDTGGQFARAMRARLEAAMRSMPRLDVRLSTTGADADLARLRARLETLASRTVGVDIDAERARAEAIDIEERLRRIGAAHPNVAVRADTAAARAQLVALREEIDRVSADPARVRVETDGSFGQRLRAAVQQAQASLPEINIGADTTPAQIEVMRLRTQLGQLADQRIGIDIDAATATARIEAIQARLQALAASDADVDVRVDAGSALAQLAAVQGMVSSLDGERARIDVDTSAAISAVLQLGIAVGSVAAIPAIPVLAAGLGLVTAAATAAGVGIGAVAAVAAPAFGDISDALQAQEQAQDAAARATERGGQAAATAARQALQMEGAQQALAAAHRNAARQIAQAEQSITDAVRTAAESNRRAAQQVADARQRLADTVQQAADRQRSAAESVVRAEERLADAQRDARRAQQDLTQARRDAADDLLDLSHRLSSAQLSERDAALSVEEARQRLAAVQAKGAKASLVEQQRAQLAYDQAVQRLTEQQLATKRLAAEKKAADKAGVDGSEQVRRAEERLAQAQRGVRDQAETLARAQQDAAAQQVRAQQDIARAQQQVAEAQRNVTRTQEQGARSVARAQEQLVQAQQSAADSITSAQRQIRSAQLSAAAGTDEAAAAQARYKEALADMTPATRATHKAFVGLKEAFGDWSESLQPHVMPLFTRAINGARKALPGFTPFVKEAAAAVGDLQDRMSEEFKSNGWKEFRDDLADATGPAIRGLGGALINIGKGLGGIIHAFLPYMERFSDGMLGVTERFANWGTGLKGSPEFEKFMDYAAETAPKVGAALGDIANAFLEVGKALAPLSGPVLDTIGLIAQGVGALARNMPWLVQGVWLAIVATRVWAIGMAILNATLYANPIGLIVLAIAALVAGLVWAYNNVDWFRKGVQAAWKWISDASKWAWEVVLKPTFDALGKIVKWLFQRVIKPYFKFMVAYWKMVARVAMWFWKTIMSPVFAAIGRIIKFWWQNIVKRYFRFVRDAIRATGAVFKWLYDKSVKPVFGWIRDRAKWLWEKGIKPPFALIRDGVGRVVESFRKGKDGIKKAWDQVREAVRKPITWVIDTVYNKAIVRLWNSAAKVLPIKDLKPLKIKGYATGGPVHGPGTTTSDSILSALSRDEHVWTAKEVSAAGGHAAVQALRQQALKSGNGYAKGGPVGAHGGIGDWIGGRLRDVRDLLGSAKDWVLGGVSKAASAAAKPIRDLINRTPGATGGWGKLVKSLPRGILSAALRGIRGSEKEQLEGAGQWAKPVAAPYGTKFGVAGRMWASGRHTGLDFPAPTGTAVKAVAGGTVSYARSGGPYGSHILIRHGKGLSSLYAHLSQMQVTEGAVKRGQRIGAVGATGNVTGPHLHLEARLNGRPVDPMSYLTGGGGAGGKGVARWRGVVNTALGEVGQPLSLANTTLRRMDQESGGDPNAVNRWDSNWRRGTPSVGLMQVIEPTFRAYAGKYLNKGPKSYGVSTNPLANIYSSMRYALARYGSLPAAYDRPGGYDSGGWLKPGQLGFNGLSQPEAVLTPRQWDAMSALAARGGSAGDVEVHVYVGDREITDIVRTEVRTSHQRLATAVRAGRKG
ncbi:peptidoglycan DD-metalloendopeptidase family protein [Streptomyces sp. OF3]|uniref:Peptidoglycan DD-metalloendopeptidase family protein n=1 Tax=Streptomyces alkaliterrae TaxID=2213162 RepID=A0A7W3ZMB0_9ACTN|nr:peptidoglycan DD-metalloendopeptidase family protein [Streptomyces alkaliterrae]MBB1253167.1 peptidoglycan DD-metalloendopeptidase family protein [Streptomyces alkaliterrae]